MKTYVACLKSIEIKEVEVRDNQSFSLPYICCHTWEDAHDFLTNFVKKKNIDAMKLYDETTLQFDKVYNMEKPC